MPKAPKAAQKQKAGDSLSKKRPSNARSKRGERDLNRETIEPVAPPKQRAKGPRPRTEFGWDFNTPHPRTTPPPEDDLGMPAPKETTAETLQNMQAIFLDIKRQEREILEEIRFAQEVRRRAVMLKELMDAQVDQMMRVEEKLLGHRWRNRGWSFEEIFGGGPGEDLDGRGEGWYDARVRVDESGMTYEVDAYYEEEKQKEGEGGTPAVAASGPDHSGKGDADSEGRQGDGSGP